MISSSSVDASKPIAIIGAGHLGKALAGGLIARGYRVRLGVPDPADYVMLEERFGQGTVVTTVEKSIAPVDMVILATPYFAALQVARTILDWEHRILVDATNPVAPGLSGLVVGTNSSGAEEIARLAPTANVVKAFNTTGYENVGDPHYSRGDVFMPVAGDDIFARRRVLSLAMLLGFDAFDLGGLKAARYLEPMAMVWLEMAVRLGHGRRFGFAFLSDRISSGSGNFSGDDLLRQVQKKARRE